ncbi:META domain-containing protein [Spirosoma soli]|uniref:META domain-containing protein n=1 Tax=Spirosoma soli TaxID=1770529 RepID=A0ABW5M2T1_9BACT
MRIFIFAALLMVVACRRPSKQFAATLTPADQSNSPVQRTKTPITNIADYRRYLKAGDELVAVGNDPAWSLTINPSKNTLRFKSDQGDSTTIPLPQRLTDSDGSFRYDAPEGAGRIKILFVPDSCVDKTSGQRYDYRVELDVRGKTYMGCGVSLRQVALLQDIWVLTDFQGRMIATNRPQTEIPRVEISLSEGRVTGTTGCNRLNGRVQADSRHIQFGPLATTKMACAGEVGRFEGDFLEALSRPLTYRIAEGKLILLHDNKPIMTFKKVD